MIKAFVLLIFFAELVLTILFIVNVIKIDKRVNRLNKSISDYSSDIKKILVDIHSFLKDLRYLIKETQNMLILKQKEYMLKTSKKIILLISIFFMRGRVKRTFLTYKFATEIFKGIKAGLNLA